MKCIVRLSKFGELRIRSVCRASSKASLISRVDRCNKMEKLASVKVVLIDLSGTIHVESQAIKGAIEAIERLRKTPIKFIFATNTTKESKATLLARLTKIGFQIQPHEIFTSLTAAASVVKKQGLKPYLVLEDDAKKDFEGFCSTNLPMNECNALVVGLATKLFNYKEMNLYFNFLYNTNRSFIAINKSRYLQTKTGLALGPGPYIAALEFATNRKATLIGKPNDEFFRQAIDQLEPGLPYENVAMIGDDLKDDVMAAQEKRMIGILVRTGKFMKEDENHRVHKPMFVFDSVVEAIDQIIAQTAPKETAPKETAPKETAPKETAPKETAPKETVAPKDASPKESSSKVAPPKEAVASTESSPKQEPTPAETSPNEGAPKS